MGHGTCGAVKSLSPPSLLLHSTCGRGPARLARRTRCRDGKTEGGPAARQRKEEGEAGSRCRTLTLGLGGWEQWCTAACARRERGGLQGQGQGNVEGDPEPKVRVGDREGPSRLCRRGLPCRHSSPIACLLRAGEGRRAGRGPTPTTFPLALPRASRPRRGRAAHRICLGWWRASHRRRVAAKSRHLCSFWPPTSSTAVRPPLRPCASGAAARGAEGKIGFLYRCSLGALVSP